MNDKEREFRKDFRARTNQTITDYKASKLREYRNGIRQVSSNPKLDIESMEDFDEFLRGTD